MTIDIDTKKSCAVVKGMKGLDDMVSVMGALVKKFGNRDVLYIFTTPDGEAVVIIFK
jgi:hypothetical protein